MQTVQFTQMRDGTAAEYAMLHDLERQYIAGLPDRVLASLRTLDDGLGGYRVTRLEPVSYTHLTLPTSDLV